MNRVLVRLVLPKTVRFAMPTKQIQVSLTSFVDFATKAGPPKITVVKRAKKQQADGYSPSTDYWKILRDSVVDIHSSGRPVADLRNLSSYKSIKNKANVYPAAINAYISWAGKKSFQWFEPYKVEVDYAGVSIRINPELGLYINGQPHVIKLYFKKDEPLSANKCKIITQLMQKECGHKWPAGCKAAILDVHVKKPSHFLFMIHLLIILLMERHCPSDLYGRIFHETSVDGATNLIHRFSWEGGTWRNRPNPDRSSFATMPGIRPLPFFPAATIMASWMRPRPTRRCKTSPRCGPEVPFPMVFQHQIAWGEAPVRVFREHRGLSLQDLEARARRMTGWR